MPLIPTVVWVCTWKRKLWKGRMIMCVNGNINLHNAQIVQNNEFYISLSINLFSYQSDRQIGECTSAQRNGGVF